MTVYQFAKYLTRWLKVKDPASASIESAQELLHAINAGVAEFYLLGPMAFRRGTFAFALGGYVERTLALTHGSADFPLDGDLSVGAPQFPDANDIFCAVSLPGDLGLNRIMATGRLRFPFTGTSGTWNATVYRDAIALPLNFHAAVSDPLLVGENNYRYRLSKSELPEITPTMGIPRKWNVETLANDTGYVAGRPLGFLRVWPMPEQVYRIELKTESRPVQFTLEQLTAAEGDTSASCTLPVADELCLSILEPIVAGRMTAGTLWEKPELIKPALDSAMRAYAMMDKLPKALATTGRVVVRPVAG